MASFNENINVTGNVACTQLIVPDRSIAANKVVHQFALHYQQAAGADVASVTAFLHTQFKDGTLISVEVTPIVAPTGGDKAFTVDLKKGSQASAFATMLSAVVTINSTRADRQVVPASLASAVLADGDTLQIVIATSGATGSQGQGVLVTVTIQENPNS